MRARFAGLCVVLASSLVPRDQRREWRLEWRAELTALATARAEGLSGLPSTVGFGLGAFSHAFWLRVEGWTVDSVFQDLKYAFRTLRRDPGFAGVAIVTLALGIGANASIFSLVNGLILRAPVGVEAPDQLVQIARSYEEAPRWDNFSWPAYSLIATADDVFSGVAGFQDQAFVVGRSADTERILGELVSGSYFDVLGIRPHLGRLLQPSDNVELGAHAVVVLSHSLWRSRFGGDRDVVGTTVPIGAQPYTVVGVAPEGFAGIQSIGSPPRMWVPMTQRSFRPDYSITDSWGSSWVNVVGRLRDGVSFDAAQAYMPILAAQLQGASAINDGMLALLAEGVGLDPQARQEATQLSFILMVIVGLVLLLTCTNVANLSLARASARRAEVAVRKALGAAGKRVARQMITESTVLAALATVVAVPMVAGAGRFLPAVFPYNVSVPLDADGRVYAFLIGIGLLAGVFFGAAPAWNTSVRSAGDALREGASTSGRSRTRLRDALVVSQLALSLGLVTATALLGRSVLNASSAEPGFEPRDLVGAVVDLRPTGRYDEAQGRALFGRLLDAARTAPGVRAATLANQMPIAGGHARAGVRPLGNEELMYEANYVVVGSDYFTTLGIPILSGRSLGSVDEEPENVVVVNEALASMFWPGQDPVGQLLENDREWTVVGVSGDVQMRSLRSPARPTVYFPLAHAYSAGMVLHVAALPGSAPGPGTMREWVAHVDPELPVSNVVDLHSALSASMAETRTIGFLVGAFALLALILAVVGLYGLVSYGVSQRVREIGIRIALGAQPASLVRLVLGRGLLIAMVGISFGLAVSIGLGRALENLLFGVEPGNMGTFVAAALLLLLASGAAAWVPARRASRVDAASSLRDA